MKYGTISGLDKPVSRLVLGCADLKDTAVLDAAVDAGVNAFDTAHVYGGSEELLGRCPAYQKLWQAAEDSSQWGVNQRGGAAQ